MEDCNCYVGLAIVEDEKELVDLLLKLFKIKKIEVCFIAYDGREALLNYIRCDPKPHLIFMDYRLPGMDGIAVMKEMLRIDPSTKVIFLSADEDIKNEALFAGATVFLQKPATLKEIGNVIQEVIKSSPSIKIYGS